MMGRGGLGARLKQDTLSNTVPHRKTNPTREYFMMCVCVHFDVFMVSSGVPRLYIASAQDDSRGCLMMDQVWLKSTSQGAPAKAFEKTVGKHR